MPDWRLVQRPHVVAAIEEYDRLGSREFLSRYRFGRARAYTLWYEGKEYDSKALLGVAYLHATGRLATREEFSGGESGAARVLKGLGFDVVVDEEALERDEEKRKEPAARRRSAKKAAKPPSGKAEPTVRICPTCHTAVPASGVCDYCD